MKPRFVQVIVTQAQQAWTDKKQRDWPIRGHGDYQNVILGRSSTTYYRRPGKEGREWCLDGLLRVKAAGYL